MFTGLIEAVGEAAAVAATPAGLRLRIATPLANGLTRGESVAVSGICLTATRIADASVEFEAGPETLRATTIGSWRAGRRVNLERAMRADGRFGGHLVQGHVDGTGTVRTLRQEGDTWRLTIGFPGELAPYFVPKGSVAVDGISLTVAALGADEFDVMIVPFTWDHTSLSTIRAGEAVNLECDMVGKYVVRAVELTTARVR
jgi:riboflavin synthase alpha subunit